MVRVLAGLQMGRVAPSEEPLVLKREFVRKLAYKGDWESRRWNDRWLELRRGGLRYGFHSKDAKEIDYIRASSIRFSCMIVDGEPDFWPDPTTRRSISGRTFAETSLWGKLQAIKMDFVSELKAAFFVRSHNDHSSATKDHVFVCGSVEEAKDWVVQIRRIVDLAKPPPEHWLRRSRRIVRTIFEHSYFEIVVNLLIALNFMAFIYQTQVKWKQKNIDIRLLDL